MLPTSSIRGLEIFSTGVWNGDSYSEADLDQMVSSFGKVGWQPFIKIGHQDEQERLSDKEHERIFGAPSLGTIDGLRRIGLNLIADVSQIPAKFAALLQAGSYKRVSAEIYWNLRDEKTKKVWPRVLKAVAFLGSEVPAVTDLNALTALFKRPSAPRLMAIVKTYQYKPAKPGSTPERRNRKMENFNEVLARYNAGDVVAGREMDSQIQARLSEHPGESYTQAMNALRQESKEYVPPQPEASIQQRHRAGIRLDYRAKQICEVEGIGYALGLRKAMMEDPATASEYGYQVRKDHAESTNTADIRLNRIVAAFMGETSLDVERALRACNDLAPEDTQAACAAAFQGMVNQQIQIDGIPGVDLQMAGVREGEIEKVKSKHQNLFDASQGEPLDESGLRPLFPKFFN